MMSKCLCQSLSHVRLFVIPWTLAHQAPPSLGFSRQEFYNSHFYSSLIHDFFLSGSVVMNPPTNQEMQVPSPGLGRSPGEGNHNPLQFSCLGNPMDRGAWWVIVHGVAKNWTQLSNNSSNSNPCFD